jgi:hypothetical protein
MKVRNQPKLRRVIFTLASYHCRQRASVGIVLSSSGTSQLGMFVSIMIIQYYYILNPEDVVIGRLFLFVFIYMFLWLT